GPDLLLLVPLAGGRHHLGPLGIDGQSQRRRGPGLDLEHLLAGADPPDPQRLVAPGSHQERVAGRAAGAGARIGVALGFVCRIDRGVEALVLPFRRLLVVLLGGLVVLLGVLLALVVLLRLLVVLLGVLLVLVGLRHLVVFLGFLFV